MTTVTLAVPRRTHAPAPSLLKRPTAVSRGFEPCLRALLLELPFARLSPVVSRLPDSVLRGFAESWERLTSAGTTEIERMVRATYLAAADDRTKARLIDVPALAGREAAAIVRGAPALTGDNQAVLNTAQALAPSDAYRLCGAALGHRATEVIARAKHSLDALRERNIVGSVAWGHRECMFTHVRCVIRDAELDRKESSTEASEQRKGIFVHETVKTVTTKSERTIETLMAHQVFTQRLAYPVTCPVPAKALPKPARIDLLEHDVPRWLLGTYLVGELLDVRIEEEPIGCTRQAIVETSVRRSMHRHVNWTTVATVAGVVTVAAVAVAALPLLAVGAAATAVAHDPALVVGDGTYVLAGWVPEELPLHRRYRIERA